MRLSAMISLLIPFALTGAIACAETPQKRDVDLSQPSTGQTGWHTLIPLGDIQEAQSQEEAPAAQTDAQEPAPTNTKKTKKKTKKTKKEKTAKKAKSKKQTPQTPPRSRWAFGYADKPIPGARYDVVANGKVITPSVQLDDWIDGTKISASTFDGGFYVMVWDHPEHVRVVVGFGGHLLRRKDTTTPHKAGPTKITVRVNGKALHSYDLDNFSQGQEISHHIGHRQWTRTPQDIIDMGLWPRMARYEGYAFDFPNRTFIDELRPSPEIPFPKMAFDDNPGYEPLHFGPVRPYMPAKGDHQVVHSSRGFAHLALWPNGETSDAAQRNIFVSAESAAGYTWHLHSRGSFKPLDMADAYYNETSYMGEKGGAETFERVGGHNETLKPNGSPHKPFTWDTAHLANASWEMYLINADPYYLRSWQMSVLTPILAESAKWRAQGFEDERPRPVISRQQPRSYGKHMMLVLRLIEVMPEGEWNWLQPKSLFEEIMENTAQQSQWTARQFGAINGDFPRSWLGGKGVKKWLSWHSTMQAYWSLGWALHLGYDGFQPLFDVHTKAVLKNWEAFGPGQPIARVDVKRKDPQTGKWRKFEDLDAAIDHTLSVGDYQGPDTALKNFMWEEERFLGILSALSQLHGEPFTGIATVWMKARQSYERDFLARKHRSRISNIGSYGFNLEREMGKLYARKPDWMFAIGPDKQNR